MIKVIVEIHPYGDKLNRRILHELEIANVGGTHINGFYEIVVDNEKLRETVYHRRDLGALILLRKAIEQMEEENAEKEEDALKASQKKGKK